MRDEMTTHKALIYAHPDIKIKESFSWLTPEFRVASTTKNTVKIKGVALTSDATSASM